MRQVVTNPHPSIRPPLHFGLPFDKPFDWLRTWLRTWLRMLHSYPLNGLEGASQWLRKAVVRSWDLWYHTHNS